MAVINFRLFQVLKSSLCVSNFSIPSIIKRINEVNSNVIKIYNTSILEFLIKILVSRDSRDEYTFDNINDCEDVVG